MEDVQVSANAKNVRSDPLLVPKSLRLTHTDAVPVYMLRWDATRKAQDE